jgi:hypothetical protein
LIDLYRGLGFLSIILFGSSPTPPPLFRQKAEKATQRKIEKERQLDNRKGGRESID